MPSDAALISSVGDGFIWIPWAFLVLGGALEWIGVGLFAVVMAVFWYFYKKNTVAWERAAGAVEVE
jgi:PTS system galactitol-specific IIC component